MRMPDAVNRRILERPTGFEAGLTWALTEKGRMDGSGKKEGV